MLSLSVNVNVGYHCLHCRLFGISSHVTGKIQQMEAEMERMASSIAAMKQSKAQAKKPAKVPKERPTPVASTSKPTPKPQPKATTSNAPTKGKPGRKAKKNANAALGDDDTLSFDQKKQLSEAISTLEGTKLEKVINIIHEGMPEIKDVCTCTLFVRFKS